MIITPVPGRIVEETDPLTTVVESPPPPKRNDPSIPTVYDDQWQFYVDLTQAQIAAYQAMPEWAAYVATQPVTDWAARAAAALGATSSIK